MGRYVLIALLLLPAAEIAAFYAVASVAGFFRALALFLGTSLIGLLILRRDGIRRILAIHQNENPTSALERQAAGFIVLAAGALLVLPGFISDIVGLLLLLAPRTLSRALLKRVFGSGRGPGDQDVVDLDHDQWEQVPDRQIENRRRGR